MTPVFYLADARTGGWATFAAHLCRALASAGLAPHPCRLGARTESRTRPFGLGLSYQVVADADAAAMIAAAGRAIVACCAPPYGARLGPLLDAGALPVVHDPTELRPDTVRALGRCRRGAVVIRKAMLGHLARLGVAARYVPHPYCPLYGPDHPPPAWSAREHNAVAISRVDFDKHTDRIAAASDLAGPKLGVRIYGTLNRLYAHHKLDALVPGWRSHYAGPFPAEWHAGTRLAARARLVVDLSAIRGDGAGGTQYTFLEAWDAGAVLVVSRRWADGAPAGSPVEPGRTALAVDGPDDLAERLRAAPGMDPTALVAAGRAALAPHEPAAVAADYVEAMA